MGRTKYYVRMPLTANGGTVISCATEPSYPRLATMLGRNLWRVSMESERY